MMTSPVRYSEALTVQVRPGFRSLIDIAARRAGTKPTEWTRQALRAALQHEGIDPAAVPATEENPHAPSNPAGLFTPERTD